MRLEVCIAGQTDGLSPRLDNAAPPKRTRCSKPQRFKAMLAITL